MTPATLQALRRLLFFSVEEAAAMIGNVSPRSWQYWERGERQIPADVIETLRDLCAWRERALDASLDLIRDTIAAHGTPASASLTWYPTIEDWLEREEIAAPIYWRPHCSVVAAVAGAFPDIELNTP